MPGDGWYYTDFLTLLGQDPGIPSLELGKEIIDDYGYYYDNDEDIEIIKNKPFEFNRKVKKERMEEYTNRDFALVRGEDSEIIIIENTK